MPEALVQDVEDVSSSQATRTCFIKYVTTKVLKRLETNKIRGAFKEAPRNLLLPISLGISSITMLHIIDEQLRNQSERSGRSSYNLHILHIDQSPLIERSIHQSALALLKERFPSHTYSIVLLEDVFDYQINFENEILDFRSTTTKTCYIDKNARFKHLMSSLPSATSRADVVNWLKLKLIIEIAKHRGYEYILYGDSTTRLAERTLSETAKGRGGSLPWLTTDGFLPHGLKVIYPMRDLLKKEISTFASITSPPLITLVLDSVPQDQTSLSSKASTIDSLMSQYFETVELNYPSIVANVVRTSSKLLAPSPLSTSLLCNICMLPIEDFYRHWGGDQTDPKAASSDGDRARKNVKLLCYGCARAVNNTE
ncbi:cytoplasmic tRNA 2-thiolation protein 2 [Pseudocyphellaria aurata]|nr:cytoplasmic tRNA 2-thiolation protein 2 [Pseudocyphellaria aurata]